MTTSAIAMMGLVWTCVTLLTVWCLRKLTSK